MKQNKIHNTLVENGFIIDETHGVWRPLDLPEFAYNDGDDAENYVLKSVSDSVDVCVDSQELADKIKDWPSNYHLSSRRSNLLKPFQTWLKGKKVLEIGCGCGAITRFLGECGAEVISVEGSLRRAQIARTRSRDLPNVEVICSPSDQIPDLGLFDAVMLIGVLEYARVFLGKDGQKTLLDSCRDRMTPEAKLFVAIENKLGIKYFSGAREDHVNLPMFGINNSYTEESVATFGRNELKGLLAQSGFEHHEEFLPIPDYKLPVSIITPSGWKNYSPQFSQMALESAHHDAQRNTESYFSLEEGIYNIWNNDLAADLSNSFLMVSSQKENSETISPADVAAYHYSDGRSKEFRKTAIFKIQDNGSLAVLSHSSDINSDSSEQVILQKDDFYDGVSLWLELVHLMNKPDWSIADISSWGKTWIKEIFHRADLPEVYLCDAILPSGFQDAMPFNFIVLPSGDKVIFDQEWCAKTPITLGYVIFRGLFHSLLRLTSISSSKNYSEETFFALTLLTMRSLGFDFDELQAQKWLEDESEFLAKVQGKGSDSILSLLREMKPNVRLESIASVTNKLNQQDDDIYHLQKHVSELLVVAKERAAKIETLESLIAEEQTAKIETLESLIAEEQAATIEKLELIIADKNIEMENNSTELAKEIAEIESVLALRDKQLSALYRDIAIKDQMVGQYAQELNSLKHELNASHNDFHHILDSTSWKITAPLRVIARRTPSLIRSPLRLVIRKCFYIGRAIKGAVSSIIYGSKGDNFHARNKGRKYAQKLYYSIPARYQMKALKVAMKLKPEWFRAHPANTNQSSTHSFKQDWMVDINKCHSEYNVTPGKVAVHCHIFYHDLIDEFVANLSAIPFAFDAYISVTTEEGRDVCRARLETIPNLENLCVEIVQNRGRDIAPMFCQFGERLKNYDFICHIQSKKSLYNGGTTLGWREYLFNALLGSTDNVKRIFRLFLDNPQLGIIYPQAFTQVPYAAFTWLANRSDGAMLCNRLGIEMPESYYHFPAGSMFWARMSAMKPLFDLNLTWDDFPEEKGQTDGTLAHALERMLGVTPTAMGYQSVIIKDNGTPSWSPFRFDHQYLTRVDGTYSYHMRQDETKVIAFDIFDTLLVRPLLNADHTKKIICGRLSESDSALFSQYRHIAEANARNSKTRDINIVDIYQQFALLTNLSQEKCLEIQKIEESVEIASVSIRKDMVHLFNKAKEWDKRVILISDMFLSEETIETMLSNNNIVGYDRLYLSSKDGLRKDTGQLYSLMLEEENVSGKEVAMFGDNERSDLQLPHDNFNIRPVHILRAADLAKSLPTYEKLIHPQFYKDELNRELTVGLLVRENLNKCYNFTQGDITLYSDDAKQLGFNLVGTTILAFCSWLVEKAKSENVTELYFLSREGKIIKQVYDAWAQNVVDAPRSIYLQVSRRAVNVPNISSIEDVRAIAYADYFPNEVHDFFYERFGLELTAERWSDIYSSGVWKEGELLEIRNRDLSKIDSLLNYLLPDILSEAKVERVALLKYLDSVGLNSQSSVAVVDVGYSGTIQKSLNRLLERPVHGFYFATAHNVRDGMPEAASTFGCFVENGTAIREGSKIFSNSFSLEQLLSANDGQLTKYEIRADGALKQHFKTLSEREIATQPIRNELQAGIMSYVDQAIDIRKNLNSDFCPSVEVADILYSGFIIETAENKNEILKKLVLDDDYCGRGLIS